MFNGMREPHSTMFPEKVRMQAVCITWSWLLRGGRRGSTVSVVSCVSLYLEGNVLTVRDYC